MKIKKFAVWQLLYVILILGILGFAVLNMRDIDKVNKRHDREITVLEAITAEQAEARRLRTALVDDLVQQAHRTNLKICKEVNTVKYRLRIIIKENDELIDDIQIPGFTDKLKAQSHRQNKKAIRRLRSNNCFKIVRVLQ